jgi:hypothetical protein
MPRLLVVADQQVMLPSVVEHGPVLHTSPAGPICADDPAYAEARGNWGAPHPRSARTGTLFPRITVAAWPRSIHGKASPPRSSTEASDAVLTSGRSDSRPPRSRSLIHTETWAGSRACRSDQGPRAGSAGFAAFVHPH